jgi:hypothetical protein
MLVTLRARAKMTDSYDQRVAPIIELYAAMTKLGFVDLEKFGFKVSKSDDYIFYAPNDHFDYYDQCNKHGAAPRGHVVSSVSSGMRLFCISAMHGKFLGLSPGYHVSTNYIDTFYDETEETVYDYSVAEVITMLTLFNDHYSSRLVAANIEATPSNILSLWSLEQQAYTPVGILFKISNPLHFAVVDAYILELVRSEVPLYLGFHSISNYANKTFNLTGKMGYTIDSVIALEGMPRPYMDRLFFDE